MLFSMSDYGEISARQQLLSMPCVKMSSCFNRGIGMRIQVQENRPMILTLPPRGLSAPQSFVPADAIRGHLAPS